MGNNIQEHIESIAETKVGALNNAIAKLVVDYDRRIDALEAALANLGSPDLTDINLRITTLEEACGSSPDLTDINLRITTLEENCGSCTETIGSLVGDVAAIRSSIDPLIEQIGVMQSNIIDLQDTVISLQNQIDVLNGGGGGGEF